MNNPAPKVSANLTVSLRRQTILVVDDNDDQWFIARWAILNTRPDIKVVRTCNALETLSYLAACVCDHRPLPALILLDLYLPDREEGWSLLESIKAHDGFRRLPVVILSNSTNPDDIVHSYERRSSSYLVKPTSYAEWLACFNHFTRYWLESVTLPTVIR